MDQEPRTIKLIVVGDGSVGKTCILLSYTTDKFPTDYVPTVFDNYTSQVQVDGQSVTLSLWDTAGQETYNQLRTLSYGSADIFVIVFAVTDPSTFENALNKWYPELSQPEWAHVPKIIVGNKIDMRDETNNKHVRAEAAKVLCAKQNIKYFETSALTQEGLKDIFDQAIKIVLQVKPKGAQQINDKKQEKSSEKNEKTCCQMF